MGFFAKLFRLILPPDDESEKSISRRIVELRAESQDAAAELDNRRLPDIDLLWYKITLPETEEKKKDVAVFTPFQHKKIRTMKDLLEKREQEKKEHIRQIRVNAYQVLDAVEQLIQNENVKDAEEKLYHVSPLVKEINDARITSTFDIRLEQIKSLKETLRQREILKKEEEERRRKEEIQRKLEKEKIEKQRIENERLQRLKSAAEYEERLRLQEKQLQDEINRLKRLVTRKKEHSDEILNYLRMKGIRCFYHFTDRQNINSIKKYGGLLSWDYCNEHNIVIPNPGGDSLSRKLDRRQGLEDYVRLSFCDDHPMAFRKHQEGSDLFLLQVSIDVAAFRSTLFSDKNAASSDFSRGSGIEHLRNVNISATQRHYVSRDEGEIFSLHQAECMVKTFIPVEYIININNPIKMIF